LLLGNGKGVVSNFSGVPDMVSGVKICACLGQKFEEGVMGRGKKIGIFFSGDLAGHAPQQTDWAL